jgi:formylglycine-generating enzyme required for sulfatase activity
MVTGEAAHFAKGVTLTMSDLLTIPLAIGKVSTFESSAQPEPPPFHDMVWIPGGTFQMGSDQHYPEEAPVHKARVDGFWIDRYPATNQEFRRFVEATGYVTVAERAPDTADYPGAKPELLVAASTVFKKPRYPVDLGNHYNWWHWMPGADWRHPVGPNSSLKSRDQHPVVHMAWEDVEAYVQWIGKQLPTESEWEFAARGGLDGAEFAWGDEFTPGGKHMANTWQGDFPYRNLLSDGFEGTSPIGVFPANGYGLFDMIGNVWEWTTDWYADHHPIGKACCTVTNPRGADRETSYDPQQPTIRIPRKVIKGGSHLCAPNYCRRYRPAARMSQPIDTGTSHLGFRCIVRPENEIV